MRQPYNDADEPWGRPKEPLGTWFALWMMGFPEAGFLRRFRPDLARSFRKAKSELGRFKNSRVQFSRHIALRILNRSDRHGKLSLDGDDKKTDKTDQILT